MRILCSFFNPVGPMTSAVKSRKENGHPLHPPQKKAQVLPNPASRVKLDVVLGLWVWSRIQESGCMITMHQPKRCLPPWFTVTFACEVRLHPEQYGFLWKYTPTSNGWSSYSCIIRAPSRRPSPWRPTSVPRSRAHPDLALDGQMAWDRPADYQRGFNHPDMGTGLEKKTNHAWFMMESHLWLHPPHGSS